MSGIAGIIRFDGAPVEPAWLEAMTAAMAHRGPDGIRHWTVGPVVLGQCTLHTTAESCETALPLVSQDGSCVLVMDGRLDNWQEMREELLAKGCRLRTRSDAELVLQAYETWGEACLEYIDGDFALALWDKRRCALFAARDRVGSKPFYYHWDGKSFTFASEMKPLLQLPWVKQKLNEGFMAEAIAFDFCTRDETCWEGLHRLLNAHQLSVKSAGPRFQRYWNPERIRELRYRSQDDYVEHYRELLFDVVGRASRSHHPVACEVSGGLDSSGVFAAAAELRRQGKLLAPALNGYTLRFEDGTRASELAYARAVGAHLGCPIEEIDPTLVDLEWVRGFVQRYRRPPPLPNGLMHCGLYAQAARAGSRVLLTGVGGDEWLTGSRYGMAEFVAAGDWPALCEWMVTSAARSGWRKSLSIVPRFGLYPLLPETIKAPIRQLRNGRRTDRATHRKLLPEKMAQVLEKRHEASRLIDAPLPPIWTDRRRQLEYIGDASRAHARETMGQLSAIAGLEQRAPLYSRAMIEFSLSIPAGRRQWLGIDKAIHRQALRGVLPEAVRARRTKAEFSSLFEHYQGQLEAAEWWKTPLSEKSWVDDHRISIVLDEAAKAKESARDKLMLWGLFSCGALASEASCDKIFQKEFHDG